jgi:hypothetical protein
VIAVVKKEDDLAADYRPELAGGDELRVQETPGKKSAGLLTETNDGGRVHPMWIRHPGPQLPGQSRILQSIDC